VLAQVDAVLAQLGGRGDDRDAAGVEDHDIVGDVEHQLGVLLDQHDRQPAFLELADGGHHLGDDLRRQAFRRLVHQQHARIAHQRAADRQHLLLAARQMRRDLAAAFLQPRKHREHGVGGPGRVLAAGIRLARRDHQVLAHRQAPEDAATLRHQRDAAGGDQLRRQFCDRFAEDLDHAGTGGQQADRDVHASGLARAVATQEPK
jgi:hypothetical protein